MKKILVLLSFCLSIITIASAQKTTLALNENNRYIYYEVVEMPGITADSLNKNANNFMKVYYAKNDSKKLTDTGGYVKDKFLMYTGFVKHEDGEMAYTLNIECKNAKYRYWVTDFVFTPYKIDRYGNSVPEQGINIPMENAKSKLDKRQVEIYLNQTNIFCKQLSDKLKLYILTGHSPKTADKKPAKIVTDKW